MVRVALLLLLTVLFAGCSLAPTDPGPPRTLSVEVRDQATREPVATALVDARPVGLFFPSWPHEFYGGSPPTGSRNPTGPDGSAQVRVFDDYPMTLFVVAPGYAPVAVDLLARHALADAEGWFDPAGDVEANPNAPRLELRLRD